MVLPELRALANPAGVKGTSGMRKNELIAAIRETRQGHTNGTPSNGDAGEPKRGHADGHAEAPAQGDRHTPTRRAENDGRTDRKLSRNMRSGAGRPDRKERQAPERASTKARASRDHKSEERDADNAERRQGRSETKAWRPAELGRPAETAGGQHRTRIRATRTRISKTTTVTGAAAVAAAGSASAGAAVSAPAKAAAASAMTPSCAKTTSSSR